MPLECVLYLWCVWLVSVKSMQTDWHSVWQESERQSLRSSPQDLRFYRQGDWMWAPVTLDVVDPLAGALLKLESFL